MYRYSVPLVGPQLMFKLIVFVAVFIGVVILLQLLGGLFVALLQGALALIPIAIVAFIAWMITSWIFTKNS